MSVLPNQVLRIPERAGAEDYGLRLTDSVERDAGNARARRCVRHRAWAGCRGDRVRREQAG